jgi:hypothetical protein
MKNKNERIIPAKNRSGSHMIDTPYAILIATDASNGIGTSITHRALILYT